MILTLKGTVQKLGIGEVVCSVSGVGYAVHVPINAWESLKEDSEAMLWIYTYVREDRFDLFGFLDQNTRTLFSLLIGQSGIGPKTALELCGVPKNVLAQAALEDDVKLMTGIKGVGKKTAEKLLVEVRSLIEKQPDMFAVNTAEIGRKHEYDQDAVSALQSLGYDQSSILSVLKNLPEDLVTTEDRVAAALRTL